MTIKDKKWKYIKTYDTLIAPGVKLQDQICQLCPASNTSMMTPFERLPTGCCVFSIVQVKIYCTWILLWDALFLTFSHVFSQFVPLLLNFFSLFCLKIALFCSFSHFFSFFSCYIMWFIFMYCPPGSGLLFFYSFLHFFACCWHVCSRVVTCMVSVVVYLCIALPPCPLGCHHGCVAVYGCVCSQPLESQTGLKRLYSKLKLLGCCFLSLILIKWEKMRKSEKKWRIKQRNEKTWENVRKSGNRWKKVR